MRTLAIAMTIDPFVLDSVQPPTPVEWMTGGPTLQVLPHRQMVDNRRTPDTRHTTELRLYPVNVRGTPLATERRRDRMLHDAEFHEKYEAEHYHECPKCEPWCAVDHTSEGG